MRLVFTIVFTVLCLLAATAQDVIVKKDGDTLRVYDLKINPKFITYRENPGKKSASKRISKAKVLSVKKSNGRSILISQPLREPVVAPEITERPNDIAIEVPVAEESEAFCDTVCKRLKGEIKRAVAACNAHVIEKYNKSYGGYGDKKQKNSKADCAVAIMGVTAGSVLANEDVEIEFSECAYSSEASIQYEIFVHNKTDKIIYLDLENCFRIYNDGTFKSYYSGKHIRQSKKNNVKVAFTNKATKLRPQYEYSTKPVKSITLSLEERKQTSQVIKENKVIAIPPKGKAALPPRMFLDECNDIVKEYDLFCTILQNSLNDWQVVNIVEQQTPYKNSFIITYSLNKNFNVFSTVNFGLYLRQMIGLGTRFSRFDKTQIQGYDENIICGEVYFE